MLKQRGKEQKMDWVFGLLVECPLLEPLEDCPAIKARKLSIKERLEFVAGMSGEELDFIINHHRDCLRKRESSINKS